MLMHGAEGPSFESAIEKLRQAVNGYQFSNAGEGVGGIKTVKEEDGLCQCCAYDMVTSTAPIVRANLLPFFTLMSGTG